MSYADSRWPMINEEHLSSLIGDIYDASLDPSLWVGVLGKCRDFVGGHAATLFWKDAVGKSGDAFYEDGGIEPYYTRLYFEKYIKLDPATTGHYFAEIEKPMATVDLIPYDEFLETRMYKEWARPQGLVDFVSALLDKSVTSVAMFGVFRHERHGLADDETRRRMRLLVPHIRRAVLIGRVIDTKTAETATFADALDGLSAGMLLVDANGRIVHAKAASHAMIAKGDLLYAASGTLVARDQAASQVLRDVFAAAGSGDATVGTKGIAVSLTSREGERYVAHVLPLTSGARRQAGTSYAAAAALFVHKAALAVPSPPEVIAKTFGLTPSELRVLLGIVEIGGTPETAEALGIAEETVKTHLKRLFAKTGATRQVDLVKLVAGYSSPLAG
jgi:DNA-binding CsgD family transcriptional regulator